MSGKSTPGYFGELFPLTAHRLTAFLAHLFPLPLRFSPSTPFPSRVRFATSTPANLMSVSYDLIIIGGGHNGLVTAAYAARAGLKALRPRASRRARRRVRHRGSVARLQGLDRRLRQQPAPAGDHPRSRARRATASRCCRAVRRRSRRSPTAARCMLGPDKAHDASRDLASSRTKDAEALPRYEAMLERVADFLEPTLVMTPPNPGRSGRRQPAAARQARPRVRASSATDGRRRSRSSPARPRRSSTAGSSRSSSR